MNDSEQRLFDALSKKGFEVLRRGWPDFLVMDKNWSRGYALELKMGKDRVSPEQARMHAALARFGLPTYVAREDFLTALRQRGRAVLVPDDYHALRAKQKALESELQEIHRDIAYAGRSLDAMSILFEPAIDVDRFLDAGVLIDEPNRAAKLYDAASRQRSREVAEALDKLPSFERMDAVNEASPANGTYQQSPQESL